MDWVFLLGRILFAYLFLTAGIGVHIIGRAQGVAFAKNYKVPMAELGVPLTGVMAVLGSVSIVLGVWGDLGALLLAAFLVLITPLMHAYWKETDPMQKMSQQVNFNKNTALLGGALILFYTWHELGSAAGLSLTDPLF